MATFSPEEIELVKSRGNNYCRQTWLGLYEEKVATETKDEQQIKDFMIDKYEKKRFYLDPSSGLRNGMISPPQVVVQKLSALPEVKPLKNMLGNSQARDLHIKNSFNLKTNGTVEKNIGSDFVADFSKADIFTPTQFTNNNGTSGQTQQSNFANFDNNPIFNAADAPPVTPFTNVTNSLPVSSKPAVLPPSEDRYAALKDLDNALKQQQESQVEWNNGSCNGSGYASSQYGSPSTAGSFFGSQPQGQFTNFLPHETSSSNNNTSNPFQTTVNARNPWGSTCSNPTTAANNFQQGFSANPFRTESFNGSVKYNGVSNGYSVNQMSTQPFQQNNLFPSSQSLNFPNAQPWNSPNPFTLGVTPGTGGQSSNPFL